MHSLGHFFLQPLSSTLDQDLTPLQWAEELALLCRRRLGHAVTIALQVEKELKICDAISCRVVQAQELVEPILVHVVHHLQTVDSRISGGRMGRMLAKAASSHVPRALLSRLPECLRPDFEGSEADGMDEGDTWTESKPVNDEREATLLVSSGAKVVHSAAAVGREPSTDSAALIVKARIVPSQTPLRVRMASREETRGATKRSFSQGSSP
jgi:hypothetical protein